MNENTAGSVLKEDNAVNSPMPEATPEQKQAIDASHKQVSPAQDLRDIQYLLIQGTFPGSVAPGVVKSYHLLERMASQIEATVKSVTADESKNPS